MQCRRLHFDAVDVIDSGRNFTADLDLLSSNDGTERFQALL